MTTSPFTTPFTCRSCGTSDMEINAFPGDLCLSCYADSDAGRRMPTASELTRMWGGK